jgi:hypothetical protein
VTAGHLVARLQFALHRDKDLDHFHHTRRQVVAATDLFDLILKPVVQRAFLRAGVLNQDFPQDHAFFAILLRIARQQGVRSFLTGVNFASENLHIPHDGPSSTDGKHLREVHRQFGERPLKSYPIMTMLEYLWITKVLGLPKRYRPLDFTDYDKEAARRELEATYGWRDYGSKHSESRFTKFYQDVYLPRKLRFDKRRLHLSSLIVSGQKTRDEALAELQTEAVSARQAERDTRFVAKKLGLLPNELNSLIDAPLVPQEALAELDGLHALRVSYFGREGAQSLFGQEEATARQLLEWMRDDTTPGLSMEQRAMRAQARYDAMRASTPGR